MINKYKHIVESKYNEYDEDARFDRPSQRFEFLTTMRYIQKYVKKGCKILEVGAGTGRYSIALAKMGYEVTAVELVDKNLEILRKNAGEMPNLVSMQGDALDLSMFADDSFDIVLNLGPMYHLFNKKDKMRAIAESVRVCKPKGVLMFAYLTHASIVWAYGVRKNSISSLARSLNKDGSIKDTPEEIFNSYYIEDFKNQFDGTDTTFLHSVATDSLAPTMRDYIDDGKMSEKDYGILLNWHFATCERPDQQGLSCHMLYICQKNRK